MMKQIKFTIIIVLLGIGLSAQSLSQTDGTLKWKFQGGISILSAPAISSDSTIIYYGSENGTLYALNTDGSVRWSNSTSSGGWQLGSPVIGPDGKIFVSTGNNQLFAFSSSGIVLWMINYSFFGLSSGRGGLNGPVIDSDYTIYVGPSDFMFQQNVSLYALDTFGNVKWNYLTGGYFVTPGVISEEHHIYFGSSDNNIYALDNNGNLLWKYKTNGWVAPFALGSDGTLYAGSWDSCIYSINRLGGLNWKYTTGGLISGCCLNSDGTIYAGVSDGYLYALNSNGTLKWKFLTSGAITGSFPLLGNNGIIYVGVGNGPPAFYAIDTNGNLVWNFDLPSTSWSQAPPALGSDGTIYFGTEDGYLYALYTSSLGLASTPWPKYHHDLQNTGQSPYATTTAPLFPDIEFDLFP